MLPLPSVKIVSRCLRALKRNKVTAYALCLSFFIFKNGLQVHKEIGNDLVSMLVEIGSLLWAQNVFDRLPLRGSKSSNSLINGYIHSGNQRYALEIFMNMQLSSLQLSQHTLVALVKVAGQLKDAKTGKRLHAEISRHGFLLRDVFIGSALVDMYAKCGLFAEAQEVFNSLPVRDVVIWTTLIAGFVKHEFNYEALNCFKQMEINDVEPNAFTYACILKACGNLKDSDFGCKIHTEINKKGLLKTNSHVGNALIDMYSKCGLYVKAHEVLEMLPNRSVVSWTALIAGYAENGLGEEALICFELMESEGIKPNPITLACSLKACAHIGAIVKGEFIDAEITQQGLLEKDIILGNSLVDMYSKSGILDKAKKVFDKIPNRDIVSWNVLMAGYLKNDHGEEALKCYDEIPTDGVCPNSVTYSCSLRACGITGAAEKGIEIHCEIMRLGLLLTEPVISNALVDMYAKCGCVDSAHDVFDELLSRDTFTWNSLVTGYSQVGKTQFVIILIQEMLKEENDVDAVALLSLLTACSHTGLIDEGEQYFRDSCRTYGFIPTIEYYSCIIDLLARAGQLGRAITLLNQIPFHPNAIICHSMLNSCRKWGNTEIGKYVFEHLIVLDEEEAAPYICLSNMFSENGL